MGTVMSNEWTPERIERLMEQLKFRANDLAAAVGCHQDSVAAWLSGKHRPVGPSVKLLERLEAECREKEAGNAT